MKIVSVENKKTKQEFNDFARVLYKNDKNWVCPLDIQIECIFNPQHNPFYKHGEAHRWILEDKNGKIIGRIAAFIDTKKAYTFEQATGGLGFFECIDKREAAFLLFDTACDWLAKRGMQAVDGPVNFGENDNYWGLLIDGFEFPAGIGMPYHKKYYQAIFEAYGFKIYYKQSAFHLDITKPFPERFWKIASWIAKKPNYSFEHFSFKKKDIFISDAVEIYNTAWKEFKTEFSPLSTENLGIMFEDVKEIVDERFIWFAYAENKPIAFLVMLPDVNQILIKLKGKLNFWNKMRFLYYKKSKTISRARILIMGVVPKYQKAGIESAIFWHLNEVMKNLPQYEEIELSWVGDFNPKMEKLYHSVGGKIAKRYITYRYLFNPELEFKRYPIPV